MDNQVYPCVHFIRRHKIKGAGKRVVNSNKQTFLFMNDQQFPLHFQLPDEPTHSLFEGSFMLVRNIKINHV